MRTRLAALLFTVALGGALIAPAAQALPVRERSAATCTALNGAETSGAQVDTVALAMCVAQAVKDAKSVRATLTGTLKATAWVSYADGLKAFAKLPKGVRVLVLPNAAYYKVPGKTKGWDKISDEQRNQIVEQVKAAIEQIKGGLSNPAVLAALQPCASMTSAGAVKGGVALSCPTALTIPVMGMQLTVDKFAAVVDPETSLPARVEIKAGVASFSIDEQVKLGDWGKKFPFAKFKKKAKRG